MYSTKIYRN